MKEKERIAKVMARAGLCSRREAERWIADGRVAINGAKLDSPAVTVGEDDEITVDGKKLPQAEGTRLFLYHKSAGLVTTNSDEKGRETVFSRMPKGLPRVVCVGRLDMNTEGLLLLTNDGELARHLELPANGWRRRYRVRAHGTVKARDLEKLARGVTVDGVHYDPIEAKLEREQTSANAWLLLTLTEGKNREVRRVLEHIGLKVNRLIRVSYGPFNLGSLPEGAAKEVAKKVLHEQIPGFFK
jgi:23S rRNA pseudouridine2605 synthase